MKIGIDGVPLTIPFPCGTKHYAQELISSLAKIDKKNEYIIFASQNVTYPKQKNFRLQKMPNSLPVLKRQLFLAYMAKKEKVDVFHYLEPYGAVFFRHPRIVTTVHDIDLNATYPILSKYFPNRIYCEVTRSGVFKNTKAFIAVSDFTKKELVGHLNKTGKNVGIFVVYNGLSNNFRVLNISIKTSSYFLTMGDFTPRKNLSRVFRAYSLLPKRVRGKYKLKVVANSQAARNKFIRLAKNLKIDSYLEVFQTVSSQKLVKLYNGARAFLYPSLYEGFGMPILEAMACGCPVITSDAGATKETSGGAAILVNPKNTNEISDAMLSIIKRPKLSESLKVKGLKRARLFSWEQTAESTLDIYRNLYKESLPKQHG